MASAQGIRAGAAYVELYARDNRLVKGLDAAARRLKAFGASITAIGSKIAVLGGAAMAPILGMVSHFASAGDQLNKMSIRTGISTEALSELGFAAEQSGADLETLEGGIRRMQALLVEAARGSKSARDSLAVLGLTMQDLNRLSPEEQFTLIADRLSKIRNPTARAALAMEIFGRNGQRLIPLLSAGARGMEELRAEARRLGLSIGGEEAQAAADFSDAWNRLVRTFKAAAFAIGSALAPDLTELMGTVTRFVVGVIDWVKQNKELVVTIFKVVAAAVAVGVGLMVVGGIISGIGAAIGAVVAIISGIGTAIGVIGSIIGAILTPIGLVIVALGALAAYLVYATDVGSQALSWLGDQFSDLMETATAAWQGIADALAAGDLGLAAKIVWLTLQMEWKKGILWLEEKWIEFKNFFVDTFFKAVFALSRFINDAWAGIQVAWVETTTFLANAWTNFISVLQRTWNRFSGFFRRVWARVRGVFGADAESEIARINEEEAQREQEINAQRDATLQQREQERQRRRNQIEQDRAGVEQELNRMQEEERRERERRNRAALAETEQELADAQREWQEALDEAARRRAEREAEREGPGRMRRAGDLEGLDELMDTTRQKVDIQGTFNALAVRGLGGESLAERTARATEQIAANTRRLVQEAQHGGLVFA
jgi:hypothetical protein